MFTVDILCTILLAEICLIWIAWSIYGPKITARFFSKPLSCKKAIIELQTSMSELKLPKEKDFKY